MTDQLKKILADEAERLYPYGEGKNIGLPFVTANGITDVQRSAHIRCAGMYTGEIEKYRSLVQDAWFDGFEYDVRRMSNDEKRGAWEKFKAKHNL